MSRNGKRTTSISGKAAPVTDKLRCERKSLLLSTSLSRRERPRLHEALLDSDFALDIAKNGIWIIRHTWVTGECAIDMTNRSDKEIEVGLDIAATGIVKAGAGRGTFVKLKNEGWTTY